MATLTNFGKELRVARVMTGTTLAQMADFLGKTASFVSAVETGQKKVPDGFVEKVLEFFSKREYAFAEDKNLFDLAAVANQSVKLDSQMSAQQQMLVSAFARSSMDAQSLEKFSKLLAEIGSKGGG
jgi:XRE family transcriptional regulator